MSAVTVKETSVPTTIVNIDLERVVKNFMKESGPRRGSVYLALFLIVMVALVGLAVYISSLHVVMNVDSDREEIDNAFHTFLYVGLWSLLVASVATYGMAPTQSSTGASLIAMFNLAVTISMVVYVRRDLRPHADEQDLSVTELDFIEYGTYSVFGGAVLAGGIAFANRDMFMRLIE